MIAAQIQFWIDGPGNDRLSYDRAVEGLYNAIINLAVQRLAQAASHHRQKEPAELASEFLIYLRLQGNTAIATIGGLKREFARFLTRSESPAEHELWTSLSEALHELRKEGRAWRLDDPADQTANHNAAVWTWCAGEEGKHPCDFERFEAALEGIKTLYPPGARRWFAEGRAPKIISPADAKELVALLIKAASGAISLRDLFEAAKGKVFVLREIAPPNGTEESTVEQNALHPEAQRRIFAEATRRAELIWNQFTAQGLTECLCGYFLPKYLCGAKVVLPEPTSTSGDQVASIKKILATRLLVHPEEDGDATGGPHFLAFVDLVAEELFARCRKNCGTAPSIEIETNHGQT